MIVDLEFDSVRVIVGPQFGCKLSFYRNGQELFATDERYLVPGDILSLNVVQGKIALGMEEA